MMSWNSTGEGHGREHQLSLQDKLGLLMEEIHIVRRDWKVYLEWVKIQLPYSKQESL